MIMIVLRLYHSRSKNGQRNFGKRCKWWKSLLSQVFKYKPCHEVIFKFNVGTGIHIHKFADSLQAFVIIRKLVIFLINTA
jgi:hypothetical protein